MKKLLTVLLALVATSTAMAQQTLVSAEAQATKQFDAKGLETFQWASFAHTNKRGVGVFGFVVNEPGLLGVSLGPLIAFAPGDNYVELSLGPGIDFARGRTSASLNAYAYFESHAQEESQKGKFMLYTNPYYSRPYGFFQMTSVMYGVGEKLSLGLYSQTEAVTGIRTQYTLGLFNVSATVGPKAVMLGIGIDLEL
ncbi:MAG TPA: hypothetical protein VGE18_02790 [Candidatus Paceibacterota bacterium]